MSNNKPGNNKKQPRREKRFLNHPEVLKDPHPHQKAYSLYWQETAEISRLTTAITLQASMELFYMFGQYCPSCSFCNPFLGGVISKEKVQAIKDCPNSPLCTANPWVLTEEIYKAISAVRDKDMTFREHGEGRDLDYEDTINEIYERLSTRVLDDALVLFDKDLDYIWTQEQEFKTWIECFYYPFEDWDADYQLIEENYIGSIELQRTEDSLPY